MTNAPQWIAVGIFHLLGGFSIDGGDEGVVIFGKDVLQEHGESGLELCDGSFGECPVKSCFDGRLIAFELERFSE